MCSIRYKNIKEKAHKLRQEGKSYGQIMRILDLKSKGTVSYWLHDIVLTDSAKLLLENNNQKARDRRLFIANENRRKRIDTENAQSFAFGQKQIVSLTRKDLILVGAALYWGEGTKVFNGIRPNPGLIFSNSDPQMICVFMRFVREILKVPEERIRAGIHMYNSMEKESTVDFWSKVTGLPKDRFYIVIQVSRASKLKRKTLPFGTLAIKINNRRHFYTMKGMIAGIADSAKK